jgi:hypothetical protein
MATIASKANPLAFFVNIPDLLSYLLLPWFSDMLLRSYQDASDATL